MKFLLIALVYLIQTYFLLGIIFALVFVSIGVQRLDKAANKASITTRLFLFPGSVAFWPSLLIKWIRLKNKSND